MLKTDKNIKSIFQTITHKTKVFLLSKSSREFLVFLFFFLLAGSFWLLQTLNNDYEVELIVPVRLNDVPDDVIITSEPVSNVRIKVKDRGTILVNYMFGKGIKPLKLDFKEKENSDDNHVRLLPEDYQKKLQAQLKNSTQILSVLPDTIDYIYSTGSSKRVPVRLQGNISAARRYYLADTLLIPDSVTIYAPPAVLDTIMVASTNYLVAEDISDTLRSKLSLSTLRGVKFQPTQVDVVLPVDVYTQKKVEIPLVGVNFPPEMILRTFPSKIEITFQVGSRRFNEFDANDFAIYVPYEELIGLGSEKYHVNLSHIPDGVSNVSISPTQVDFLIEKKTVANDY